MAGGTSKGGEHQMNKNLKQIAVPLVSVLFRIGLGCHYYVGLQLPDALWGYELLFKKPLVRLRVGEIFPVP